MPILDPLRFLDVWNPVPDDLVYDSMSMDLILIRDGGYLDGEGDFTALWLIDSWLKSLLLNIN